MGMPMLQLFFWGTLDGGFSEVGAGSEGTSESGPAVMEGGGSGSRDGGAPELLSPAPDSKARPSSTSGGADEKLPRAARDVTGPGRGVVKCVTTRRWSCHG